MLWFLSIGIWLFSGPSPVALEVSPTKEPIQMDGIVNADEWADALVISEWYETNPGDNVPPKVKNIGYITYDDRYFYVGLIMHDPNPERIVAPVADRDQVPSYTDYAGIFLDTADEGRVSQMFLTNPRGVQYDAISGDSSGEDSSPDFFWDVKAQITDQGWNAELRIPFSSLRYNGGGDQTWRFMLYRNYPREFRYQMFSNRLPRDKSCFICNVVPINGLRDLPQGGHLVVAPYAFGSQSQSLNGQGDLETEDADGEPGLDLKWTPTPALALDLAVNPDFSQIESDTAQITTNERFALFFAEKRPFFLEGADLFSTPLRAVHTRTITDPNVGARATGKLGKTSYTVLGALDDGGGSVVIPGDQGSSLVDQDFRSQVWLTRLRRDVGKGFVSFLASDRELEGGGFNRVIGPDFDWRPSQSDRVVGQVLYSQSETPIAPDLHHTWDGRALNDWAGQLWYQHSNAVWDTFIQGEHVGPEFRAENGFIPQVGYSKHYFEVGRTWRYQDRFLYRLRSFFFSEYTTDEDHAVLYRLFSYGAGMSGKKNSFFRFRYARDTVRLGEDLFDRDKFFFTAQANPGRVVGFLNLNGNIGDEIDYANGRPGRAVSVDVNATFQPTDHLNLDLTAARRWLDVDTGQGRERLFSASVARLRTNYNFTAKMFLRFIGQYTGSKRNPDLYTFNVSDRSGAWTGSLLWAYKLNWQSVMFVGYGDAHGLDEQQDWQTQERSWFLKLSYAYQR
ncbi:MAG: carbohydrate binding family 9 domain-containing protein [Acidobacteria bacterium]|nr:carbohydrate binding family 9 domain-containing protein [Acidobacteriota bacterium]